ncbi:hypothetical protein J5X98_05765 [Leptothermofonsia sichuanensis E412]|uniref:hypothetical protein n=1 Tax=Leptothermofonsia sichuanensis TaxID=2917832 RepID=UPI001CA74AD2|nr:hypothetical protein [Leptothermofonsia sichuanensis]QZZ21930.1 hypothetical protein J5X98_05765 [Leptothermofonsia sichuanensis E412]
MSDLAGWYIIQQENGQCIILPAHQVENTSDRRSSNPEQWGPYGSQQEAIARRVGLIRAGKCKPA